ncbi:MAG TPA: carbohydrate-binding protein [Candidatus Sulfotelmatobacter sp.]|nr:carbohydrate-binding protein [Candidatus Sulfotelmatobacter sp.]
MKLKMKLKNLINDSSIRKTCFTATFAALAALGVLSFSDTAHAQANTEAASYNSDSDVQTENCAEGGLDVGYIGNGSWVAYNQVNLNGATTFQARVASAGSGGNIEIHLDSPSGTLIGTCPVAVTGGWQSWTTVTANLSGASGFHNVYLVFTGNGNALFNVEWFSFQSVPNTEAASYNSSYGVQTEPNSEGGGLDVGYISNGSYIEFNQINLNGVTGFAVRTASDGSGGTISVCLDSPSGQVIGKVQVSPTGGWQTWTTENISLSGASGCHNVYLVFNGSGNNGLFNVEWFAFQGAVNGTEAASYNNENSVQTENCSEGGLDMGYIGNGSWAEYNQLNMNGVVGLSVRTAALGSGGTISVYLDNPNGTLIGTVQVPGTGAWQNWSTETIPVSAASGYHNVYLVFTSGFNLERFSFLTAGVHTTAAGYNSASSVQTENCSEGGLDVGYISNGSYIEFNQVNLNGATSFTARTASDASGGSIGIYLDSPNGTLIGTMPVSGTGGWETWSTQTISLSGASGYHNVYLVFTGQFNTEWFTFGNAASSEASGGSGGSGGASGAPAYTMLHASGTQIVNASGQPVQLTGVNLGSLMVMEGWMCPLDSGGLPDNYSVIQELDNRFGVAEEQNMIRCYQTNWITITDLQNIKNAGFNCVRVPVWWGDFYTLSSYGANSGWRSDAFTELDWIVNSCASLGLYVIIDMHGVVGGQSTSQDCGQQNQNTYWGNSNYQGDTAWMWWQIANHYNGNPTVAGYDLLNEPDGAPSTSAVWNNLNYLYNSVRSADPGHMIIMEGTFGNWDWDMLPNPSTYGWTDVAYEMHEYQYNAPISQVEGGSQDQVADFNAHKSWNVPCYIGEWNDMGMGAGCYQYSIGLYNSAGMSWTMWAYKAMHGLVPDGWGWYDPTWWPAIPNISSDSAATIYSDWQQWQTTTSFGQNGGVGL